MKKPHTFWDQNAANHRQSAWDRKDWDQNDFNQKIGNYRRTGGFRGVKNINLKSQKKSSVFWDRNDWDHNIKINRKLRGFRGIKPINQNREILYIVFIMVSLICSWIPLFSSFSSNSMINNVVFLFVLNVLQFLLIKKLHGKRNMMNSSQEINQDDMNQKQYEIPNIVRIKVDLPKFSDINIKVDKKIN